MTSAPSASLIGPAVEVLTNTKSEYVSVHSYLDLSLTAHASLWETGELSNFTTVWGEIGLNVHSLMD